MMRRFQQVRRKLIAEGRLKRFLIYALGEVLLVVVGILIALAINNRKEERFIRAKEQIYLEGLKNEFEVSRLKLLNLIQINEQIYRESKQIVAFIDRPENLMDEGEFSKLMFNAFAYDLSFNPNNSFLNEMINTGGLKDVSDPELRAHLVDWSSRLTDIAKQEADLQNQREKILDLFRQDQSSIRTILDLSGISESELQMDAKKEHHSNLHWLKSREFENNILIFVLSCKATEEEHYKPLLEELNLILQLIQEEIQ